MPIKAKYNGSYKDITDLMNVDESIDYVLAKTSSSYKRVYTATRSIEGIPPTTFKSIKPGANLTDYRIYGNTSKNILPLSKTPKTETIGDILCEYDGKGTFTFTSNVDNPTYTQDQWFWVPFEEDFDFPVGISDGGHGCIQLNNDFATGYGVTPYFVGFANRDNGEFVSGFNVAGTALNIVDTNYYTEDLEGLPANCITFQYLQQIGKRTVTIKPALYLDIRTQQPFEPYGESVGDRTGNLFDGTFIHRSVTVATVSDNEPNRRSIVVDISNFNNGNKITFSRETGVGSVFQMYQVNSPLKGGALLNDNIFSGNSETLLATLTLDNISNYPYLMIFLNGARTPITDEELLASKIMVNVGNTALPYEPYGYKVPVTVEGKNLYKISTFRDGSTSAVVSAVTFTINNNAVSISGISSAQHPSVTSQRFELISGETYSAKIFVDGSYDGKMYIIMRGGERQDGSDEVKYKRIDVGSGDTFVAKTYNSIIYVAEGTNKEFNAIVRVILIKGSMLPDTYEPYHAPITTPIYLPEPIKKVGDEAEYIDYGEQKQHRVRKNLLQNIATSKTLSTGITVTVNDNKSMVINGTSSTGSASGIVLGGGMILEKGAYILSGCPQGGSNNTYKLYCIFDDDGERKVLFDIGGGATIVLNGDNPKVVDNGFYIYALSCDNNVFSPMLRKADITDDTYEPYIENTDIDVTLPALPTLPGTNVLSVGTEVQPSKIDITGHIKTISGGS